MRKTKRRSSPQLQQAHTDLGFCPKLVHLPFRPLLFHLPRKVSWGLSHIIYFPALCLACVLSICYGRPLALVMKPREEGPPYVCSREMRSRRTTSEPQPDGQADRHYVEISGYSFVGWGIIAVDDPSVIRHEFAHVQSWLGPFSPGKLAFNLVPLMIAGIFITPLIGLGAVSFALSLAVMLAFSLMSFVKIFH